MLLIVVLHSRLRSLSTANSRVTDPESDADQIKAIDDLQNLKVSDPRTLVKAGTIGDSGVTRKW